MSNNCLHDHQVIIGWDRDKESYYVETWHPEWCKRKPEKLDFEEWRGEQSNSSEKDFSRLLYGMRRRGTLGEVNGYV